MASEYRAPQPLPRIPPTDEILPATRRQIQAKESLIESILQTVSPSTACFNNVIAPLAADADNTCGEYAVIDALKYGSSDQATQRAVEEGYVLWSNTDRENDKRKKLSQLIKAVKDKAEPLDYESEKLVARTLEDYTGTGFGELSQEDLVSWQATMQEIEGLKTEFARNLRHYHGTLSFTDEELDGIPKIEVESYQIGPDGKRQIPVNGRDDSTVMRYANNPDTRKRMLEAHGMKVPQNAALFTQIVHLKDLNARRRGLGSHAAFRLPDRMAESTEWIDNLLDSLAKKLRPLGEKYTLRLEAKKRSHLASANAKIESWDIPYYRRLIEEEAAVDHKRISEYFPARHTVVAMLDLFSSYLQLHFAPIPAEELKGSTWSDDIEVWSVWDKRADANGMFIGYLYADLFERPNKYKGDQCVNLQPVGPSHDGFIMILRKANFL
jgi:metallopeptidase MepB